MNPQNNSSSLPQGANSQDVNPAGTPADAGLPPLGQEAANTEMPAGPVAGQMIEPQTPVSSTSMVSGSPAAAATTGVLDSSAPQNSPAGTMYMAGTPAAASPAAPAKHGKKSLFTGLVAGAVVLLFSGGAAAAYFGYYVPNQPDNILKLALANSFDTAKTKTVQFSGSATVNEAETSVAVKTNFQGTGSNESGAFDVTTELDVLQNKLTLDARSTDGKTFYFKLGGLKDLSQLLSGLAKSGPVSGMDAAVLSTYAPLLGSLDEQWISVDASAAQQASGAPVGMALSSSDRQKIVDAYKTSPFLAVKAKLADEAIKGTSSYHYKIGVDKAKLKSFLAAVKGANIASLKLTDDELRQSNSAIDKANLDALGLELWIAKSDKTIRQVVLAPAIDGDKLDLRVTIDSYNKDVTVQKPAGAKSVEQVMSELLSGSLSSTFTLPELQQQAQQSGISL